MKTEEKIYRVQLVLNDTIYENEEVNVFQTEDERMTVGVRCRLQRTNLSNKNSV